MLQRRRLAFVFPSSHLRTSPVPRPAHVVSRRVDLAPHSVLTSLFATELLELRDLPRPSNEKDNIQGRKEGRTETGVGGWVGLVVVVNRPY